MSEKVAVIGIGKLGLCFALSLTRAGYEVIGIDIDPDYVDQVNRRALPSDEPGVAAALREVQGFTATTDLGHIREAAIELVYVFVATPSTPEGGYDHDQIDRVADQILAWEPPTRPIQLVIGCTTMPGYCDTLAERLAPYGHTVSYNPEFIAQGRIMQDLARPDQVLIGEADAAIGDRLEALYRRVCENEPAFHRMDRLSAEITKLATNCFLTTKIAFANAIGDLALQAGARPNKILAAIGSDSRIGPKYLGYGFGFGGPCFPRDNRALGLFARQQGQELLLSDATDQANARHLDFQVRAYLDQYPPETPIEFNTVTYKPDSPLLIESQQLALALALARAGRRVVIRERPAVTRILQDRYPGLFELIEM
ncbi:MAG: UDP-glucose/GDP-mannose dehydrogenase family protein [Lewinella sp.]|nr:UDP-glucose/GDP-mannose dehydrogenase family protein [Lewinella sp.]